MLSNATPRTQLRRLLRRAMITGAVYPVLAGRTPANRLSPLEGDPPGIGLTKTARCGAGNRPGDRCYVLQSGNSYLNNRLGRACFVPDTWGYLKSARPTLRAAPRCEEMPKSQNTKNDQSE